MIIGAIFVVVAIAAGVATFALGEDEETTGDIVLSMGVDDVTGEPIDDLTSFGAGVTNIFAAVPVADAEVGDTFEFRWQGEADAQPLETQYTVTEEAERNWVYSELVVTDGLAAGAYTVEVYRDDELVEERAFTVTE
jgi:hypothetical protein